MQSVHLNLHNFKQSEDSYALTHRWEALCLQEMQLHVHTAFSFEEAHEKASFLDDLVSLVQMNVAPE